MTSEATDARPTLESIVREYLEAFGARDLEHCVSFYAPDATLAFHNSHYSGLSQIETWHRERFAADLRMLRLDGITAKEDTVTVLAVATSNRLKAWKISSINGVITAIFAGSKIKNVQFDVKMTPW